MDRDDFVPLTSSRRVAPSPPRRCRLDPKPGAAVLLVERQRAREKMDAGKPQTRASVVTEMEAAIAASYPVVEGGKPIPQLIGWLDHQGEHYGKMVTAYRVNGIVPPISRPKK